MTNNSICVLKFGSSVLRSPRDLPTAALEIYREIRRGRQVVAVVSAFAGVTDTLLNNVRPFTAPADTEVARLLATGETSSGALLALQLDELGVPAQVLDYHRTGLRTRGPVLDGSPCDLDPSAFLSAFEEHDVVVVSGFVGCGEARQPTLLGRGGSDLTALFIAHRLGAGTCRLLKDVPGLYPSDPRKPGCPVTPYSHAPWSLVGTLGRDLVQPKAVRFARRHRQLFSIATPGEEDGTWVGPFTLRLAQPKPAAPVRVAMMGLGTVGLAVYRWLKREEERFEVVGVGVRDADRRRASDVDTRLLTSNPVSLLHPRPDLVIELAGGLEPAGRLLERALTNRIAVVTANKQLIASRPALDSLSRDTETPLLYSAAVGGAVPVVEAAGRAACGPGVARISAILNGTSNFILDRLRAGDSMGQAVRLSQRKGFAEADPAFDLDGTDAAFKAVITAAAAFSETVSPDDVDRRGLESVTGHGPANGRGRDLTTRLVSRIVRVQGTVQISVAPESLPADHFLAGAQGEENRVIIEQTDGSVTRLQGRGAGAGPTSLAVMADVMEVRQRIRKADNRPVTMEAALP